MDEPTDRRPGRNDPADLRRAFGCFPTGVTVLAARASDGTPRGFTANSFCSVSLEPPLVSICIDHRAASLEVFRSSAAFAVNVLSGQQRPVSDLFASKAPDKFERVGWRVGRHGAPLLDASLAWFECRHYRHLEAGDHLMLIGEVLDYAARNDLRPLGFCQGNYLDFSLEQSAVLQTGAGGRIRVGAILERAGRIALVGHDGGWTLPVGAGRAKDDPHALPAVLRALGLEAHIDFLFSVFDGPGGGEVSIFYRGELQCEPAPGSAVRLFAYQDLPWQCLPGEAERSLLRRYIAERESYAFGVYVGSADSGEVSPLG